MNKYKEALNTIQAIFIPVIFNDNVYGEYHSMEHLYNTETYEKNKKYFNTIKELVDKETPMKLNGSVYYPTCSKCGNPNLNTKWTYGEYCSGCGQKIDWSDEE